VQANWDDLRYRAKIIINYNYNKSMKKIIYSFFLLQVIFLPALFCQAADSDSFFKAEVLEIVEQQGIDNGAGEKIIQQNLLLKGLDGEFAGQEIEINNINDVEVLKNNIYQTGDKIMVVASYDNDGNVFFYITDYVRSGGLWWLAAIFVLALLAIGRWKGLRSLLSLALSFFIIIKFILPKIMAGSDPVIITMFGALVILLIIIYLTEGFCRRSHVAVASVLVSLALALFLSQLFVGLTKLTGMVSDEAMFLLSIGGQSINFQGLLLAGIIIGFLGVLDDVVISQVAAVEQLSKTDNSLNRKGLFGRAYQIGVSHVSSMANTLFLAYAGVSLPLLILFISGQSAFTGWGQIINNEMVATEIVRTLAGSIGLILAVPISTFIAAWWYGRNKNF
jgi:uncharacterized membrane protein